MQSFNAYLDSCKVLMHILAHAKDKQWMDKSDTKLNKSKLEEVLIISCATFFIFVAAIVENNQ